MQLVPQWSAVTCLGDRCDLWVSSQEGKPLNALPGKYLQQKAPNHADDDDDDMGNNAIATHNNLRTLPSVDTHANKAKKYLQLQEIIKKKLQPKQPIIASTTSTTHGYLTNGLENLKLKRLRSSI
jgi:hypothetical protein